MAEKGVTFVPRQRVTRDHHQYIVTDVLFLNLEKALPFSLSFDLCARLAEVLKFLTFPKREGARELDTFYGSLAGK